jgi:hypothetical protein
MNFRTRTSSKIDKIPIYFSEPERFFIKAKKLPTNKHWPKTFKYDKT